MRQADLPKSPQHSKDIVTKQIPLSTFPIPNLANGKEADGTNLLGRLVKGCLIKHLLGKDVVPINKAGFLVLIQHLLIKQLMLRSAFSQVAWHVSFPSQHKLPTVDPFLCTSFQMCQVPALPDIVQFQVFFYIFWWFLFFLIFICLMKLIIWNLNIMYVM